MSCIYTIFRVFRIWFFSNLVNVIFNSGDVTGWLNNLKLEYLESGIKGQFKGFLGWFHYI